MLGTYFLGATIVTHQALSRVKTYKEKILGPSQKDDEEIHLTVLPPFLTTYNRASDINFGCGSASIFSRHPINTTIFTIRGLDIMDFGDESFVHFPVQAHTQGEETWEMYVLRTRRVFLEMGMSFKSAIPEDYRPHITVYGAKNIASDRSIASIVRESRKESVLHFHAAYLTLYAKYKHGWGVLSHDPAKE